MRHFAIAALFLLFAGAASGETDYVCLKSCISGGESHGACLAKCSYSQSGMPSGDMHTQSGCLQTCVASGAPAGSCMSQCTNLPQTTTIERKPDPYAGGADPHNAFKAPIPDDGTVLIQHRAATPATSLDYGCLNVCLKGGMQYQMCSQRCVKSQ